MDINSNNEKKKLGRPRGTDSIEFLRNHPEALEWSRQKIAEHLGMKTTMVANQISIATQKGILRRKSALYFVDGNGASDK